MFCVTLASHTIAPTNPTTITVYYKNFFLQIEENSRALEYLAQWGSTSSLESAGTTSSKDKWKQGARKTLLQWVANALPKYDLQNKNKK